ncbi:uncharacterized protein LOC136033313 [Artemia franciscana]
MDDVEALRHLHDSQPEPGFEIGRDALYVNGEFLVLAVILQENRMDSCYQLQLTNGSTLWCSKSSIRALNRQNIEDQSKKSGNEIDEKNRCTTCGKVFHVSCQKFKVDGQCSSCCLSKQNKENTGRHVSSYHMRNSNRSGVMHHIKRLLPYELQSLTWDSQHIKNSEGVYCYCGGDGDWSKKMLQCSHCLQWFHSNCILCLQHTLLNGDRFYRFLCGVCNCGPEYLSRLPLTLCDALRLILFDLETETGEKLMDSDKRILPHVEKNWKSFQLSGSILNLSKSERDQMILAELAANPIFFVNGAEFKLGKTLWGLRADTPPFPPAKEPQRRSQHAMFTNEQHANISVVSSVDVQSTSTLSSLRSCANKSSEERCGVIGANERVLRRRSALILGSVLAENHPEDTSDSTTLARAHTTSGKKKKRKMNGFPDGVNLTDLDPCFLSGTINLVDYVATHARKYGDDMNPFRWLELKQVFSRNRKLCAKDLIIRNNGEIRLRKKRKKIFRKLLVQEQVPDSKRLCIARKVLPLGGYGFIYEDDVFVKV